MCWPISSPSPNAPAQSATQRAHWLDYGRDFYAGVTFNNVPKNRRIMIAWMNNWQYAGSIPTDPWRSAMSVPRDLGLQTVGDDVRLKSTPGSRVAEAAAEPLQVEVHQVGGGDNQADQPAGEGGHRRDSWPSSEPVTLRSSACGCGPGTDSAP